MANESGDTAPGGVAAPGMPARLSVPGGIRTGCQLLDFRFGVLRLNLEDWNPANAQVDGTPLGEDTAISLEFGSIDGEVQGEHKVDGRVVGILPRGLILELMDPDPRAVVALDALTRRAASARGPVSDGGAADADTILARLAAQVGRYLDSTLELLFTQARETFFVAARDAASPTEESRQLGLMEEVEGLAGPVSHAFRDSVRFHLERLGECETLSAALEEGEPGPAAPSHMLSLVDTLKLDDWVRLRTILGRHSARLEAIQQRVEQRLSDLSGARIVSDNNPVGLAGMCSLFHDAMQNMGAERSARRAIFDAFESSVIQRLDELLETLTGPLASDEAARDDLSAGSVVDETGAQPPPGGSSEDNEDAAHGSARTQEASGQAVDPARLQSVLNAMTRARPMRGPNTPADAASLQTWLTGVLGLAGSAVPEQATEAITVVSELTASLLGEARLSDSLKSRLWRLTPPMLALALQDDEYLAGELDAARHDPVTGLLDRPAFRARLRAAFAGRPDRYGCLLCLIDVDDFASISASWGRAASGRMLRLLAGLLHKHMGERGTAARLRGEEFAVLLQGPAVRRGFRFADRFRRAVEQSRWVYDGRSMALSVSIGIAAAGAGDTAEGVMQAADTARVVAKAAGGNRIEANG